MDVYDLDTMMDYLGDFGKYQMWQFSLHILAAVTAGLHMLSLVTVAAVPNHRCQIPDLDHNKTMTNLSHLTLSSYIPSLPSGEFDSCSIYNQTNNNQTSTRCTLWAYDSTYYKSSRAIEWDLVCDRRWMGAVAQSVFMFGVFTGAVVLGNMADKYGRKPIFCWSATLQLIIGVAVAFTPEYYSFLLLRYLYGIFGSAGSYITGFVLTMELVGPSKRSMCGVAFQAAFACGIMMVAGWGVIIHDRQLLQVVYGLHSLLLIGHWWLMDESPRWLWAQGRTRESVQIVRRALKINNSPINIERAEFKGPSKRTEAVEETASILDLFKTPNLRIKTLNVCLAWFANSLVYYGLSLNTGSMSGNPYFILFIMGLVELPSYVMTVYLMDRLGRRSLTAFNMIAGGICCIVAANSINGSTQSIALVFAGKFLIASSFAIVYNYSAELFPTVIRNSALGLGSMSARTSGALTPLITLLDSFDPTLPSIIFAVIAVLSGILVLFLPETLNKPMPQSIEDGENFGIGDTFFASVCGKKVHSLEEPAANKMMNSQQLEPLNVTR